MMTGWVLGVSALLVVACQSASQWEGQYEKQGAPHSPKVTLTLQDGGKGAWSVEQETTSVRWEESRGSLWLHFKAGGVIAAHPIAGEQALLVELPGVGPVRLQRK